MTPEQPSLPAGNWGIEPPSPEQPPLLHFSRTVLRVARVQTSCPVWFHPRLFLLPPPPEEPEAH